MSPSRLPLRRPGTTARRWRSPCRETRDSGGAVPASPVMQARRTVRPWRHRARACAAKRCERARTDIGRRPAESDGTVFGGGHGGSQACGADSTAGGSAGAAPGGRLRVGQFQRQLAVRADRLVVPLVRLDDALHQGVAHHVAFVELHEADAFDALAARRPRRSGRCARPLGRSICVMSPLTTILELKPWRVSTIFICSGVLFCASSRMMKLSLSVRPRMKAMGATSMALRSSSFSTFRARACRKARRRAGAGTDRLSPAACRAESPGARRLPPRAASE